MKDKVEIYSDFFPTCLGIVNGLKGIKLPSPKFGENLIGPSFVLQETHFSKVMINVRLLLTNRIRLNCLD